MIIEQRKRRRHTWWVVLIETAVFIFVYWQAYRSGVIEDVTHVRWNLPLSLFIAAALVAIVGVNIVQYRMLSRLPEDVRPALTGLSGLKAIRQKYREVYGEDALYRVSLILLPLFALLAFGAFVTFAIVRR